MTVDDAYAELGLPPGANLAQAKAAWRNLVSRWHPDRNGHADASARMQRINRALEQIRSATSGSSKPPATEARPATRAAPAHTVHRRVQLTLEEAAAGCIKVLQGTVVETCTDCAGTGQTLKPLTCAACEGEGKVHERTWFGWFGPATPCTSCDGAGELRPPCAACAGSGKVEAASYRLSVRLPANMRSGDMLHVAPGRTRTAVALDITVEVLPHEYLVRDDDGTVRCELPVDGFAWIANRSIEIPTLQGLQVLGLQRGQVVYRLAGKGFLASNSHQKADQIVIIVPQFPAQLSREQERLLDKLAASTVGGRTH
jgi:molecular chaperone DnaJ